MYPALDPKKTSIWVIPNPLSKFLQERTKKQQSVPFWVLLTTAYTYTVHTIPYTGTIPGIQV